MPIFRVKSVKIYTGQKNLHWRRRLRRRQLSGMEVGLGTVFVTWRFLNHGGRLFFLGSRSVFIVFMVSGGFYGFSCLQVGFHGFRLVFMVLGGFSWFFIVPGWFFYGFRWVFMVFRCSRLVFHGSRWFSLFLWFQVVFMVFYGSWLVFYGSRSVFMVLWSSLGLAGHRPALA